MQITLEKKDKVNALVRVQLQAEDYNQDYQSKLKEYSKKVQLKGFRPGHVPVSIVEKIYGKSILAEEVNQIASKNLFKYLDENKINIIAEPLPDTDKTNIESWEPKNNFDFYYQIGLQPDFSYPDFKKTSFESYTIEVDDTTVKETISNLRSQFGEVTEVSAIEDDSIFYANVTEAGAGRSFNGIIPEYRLTEKGKKLFIGATVGQKVEANVNEIAENEAAIAHMLGIKKEEVNTLSNPCTFEITKISGKKLAELNADFYSKVYRNTPIESYEQFEALVKEDISKNYQLEGKYKLQNDVFDYLMENIKMEFPVEFLKRWIYLTQKDNPNITNIDEAYPSFEKGLKWDLIKSKIAQEHELKVTYDEVLLTTKQDIYRQFGISASGDERLEQLVTEMANNMLKKDNGDEYRKKANDILGDKVLDKVATLVTTKQKTVSPKQFKEIVDNSKKK